MSTLLDHAFNGLDLALCIIALAVAWAGSRYDKKRNAR